MQPLSRRTEEEGGVGKEASGLSGTVSGMIWNNMGIRASSGARPPFRLSIEISHATAARHRHVEPLWWQSCLPPVGVISACQSQCVFNELDYYGKTCISCYQTSISFSHRDLTWDALLFPSSVLFCSLLLPSPLFSSLRFSSLFFCSLLVCH
jgi:hypothetical protein